MHDFDFELKFEGNVSKADFKASLPNNLWLILPDFQGGMSDCKISQMSLNKQNKPCCRILIHSYPK